MFFNKKAGSLKLGMMHFLTAKGTLSTSIISKNVTALILIVMAILLTPCRFCYNLTFFSSSAPSSFLPQGLCFSSVWKSWPLCLYTADCFSYLGLSFHSNPSERSSLDTVNKQDDPFLYLPLRCCHHSEASPLVITPMLWSHYVLS